MFSSCKTNKNIPEVTTSASTETTSLTLTELLENDDFINENNKINIGIFDPFSDKRKADKTEEKELREAVHRISDAYAFLNASPVTFAQYSEYYDSFAETGENYNRYAGSKKFYPVNENYAKTEDELFNKIRSSFTEDYISDEELKNRLFESDGNSEPNYKTIDGKLCINGGVSAYALPIGYDLVFICSHNGDTAEAVAEIGNGSSNYLSYYITLKKSDRYGWRLDRCDTEHFYYKQAAILYSALYLKTGKLNKILGGGNLSSEDTLIDGKTFVKTDIDMSIEEMREFFKETFYSGNDDGKVQKNLLEDYTNKYINNVYREKDGVIYRYKYAPKYYLPIIQIDTSKDYDAQVFYNEISKEYIECPVSVRTERNSSCGTNEYTSLLISSELPVSTVSGGNILRIELEEPELFPGSAELNESTTAELSEALAVISDSRAILYCNMSGFEYTDHEQFIDRNNIVEENELEEYSYVPVNQEYASDPDELTKQMRSVFTENYISDEELHNTLFEYNGRNVPEYKMIDGKLCACFRYMGVMPHIRNTDFTVISYDGNSAELAAGVNDPLAESDDIFITKIVKSDEYGWRLDSIDYKSCYPIQRNIVYNALLLRAEKLNKIFSGGNIPENAETIEVNGETYTETDLDISISDMEEFFVETFSETVFYNAYSLDPDYIPMETLREDQIKKYISDVYTEKDGTVFRKNSAARYYLPELIFDPYIKCDAYGSCSDPYEGDGMCYEYKLRFRKADGNVIVRKVDFSIDNISDPVTGNYYHSYLHIASELPLIEIQ